MKKFEKNGTFFILERTNKWGRSFSETQIILQNPEDTENTDTVAAPDDFRDNFEPPNSS